jgi:hypothetical protein
MRKEQMIAELVGKTVIVNAKWCKENDDEELLDFITSSNNWGKGIERKLEKAEAVIEMQFDEGGVTYYADYESSKDDYPSQNQPPWGDDSWDGWDIEAVEKVYRKITE